MTDTKRCNKCKIEYPRTSEYFSNKKRHKDGLDTWCRTCSAEATKLWREKNPERAAESRRRYRENNRAFLTDLMRQWRINNPEKFKMIRRVARHNRRLKIRHSGSYSIQDIQNLLIQQENYCYYCGKTLDKFHVDHKQSLSKGGSNNPDNLCIACPRCNDQKGTKTPEQWKEAYL